MSLRRRKTLTAKLGWCLWKCNKGKDYGISKEACRIRTKSKCIRKKSKEVKMVDGEDIRLKEVEGLMARSMVKRFSGNSISPPTLKFWLMENWLHVLGYVPTFHVLVRN
jgi:hypothetical protein